MKLAKLKDLDKIYRMFMVYKDIFPHIRKDYLQRFIEGNEVVFQNDVVIVFHKYKKSVTLGTTYVPKGHCILHQIVTGSPGKGKAQLVCGKFIRSMGVPVWLTVRKDNERAIGFYTKMGFVKQGTIKWKDDTIPGIVMVKGAPKQYW